MGSEEDNKSRGHNAIAASIAVMPIRKKLAIVIIAIFFGALLFVGSLQDLDKKVMMNAFLMDNNDFSSLPANNKGKTKEVNKTLHTVEEDNTDYDLIEEEVTPEQLNQYRSGSIFNRLSAVSDSKLLYDETSPQGMAFKFLTDHDKRNIHPDEDLLLQRYALAAIYFATGGYEWMYGNLHFLSGVQECHWHKKVHSTIMGVAACDSNMHITHLQLSGNNLLGTIPSEIRLLQRLEKLDLGNNKLEGIIPSEIGELTEMTFLSLNTNYFTGSIPQEIGQMTKAEEILLQFNELEGVVPTSICDLKTKNNLYNFWTDCASSTPPLYCTCCSICCNGFEACAAP